MKKKKTTGNMLYLINGIVVLGLIHPWFLPSKAVGPYLAFFAVFYSTLLIINIVLVIREAGWKRVSAVIGSLVALIALVYDIFGLALTGMQF